MQRAHPSRCHARHTSSAITLPWATLSILPPRVTGTRRQAEQRTRPRKSAAPTKAGTNTASEPTGPPLATALPWGRGHLDYARLEGDASCPSDHAEQALAQDLAMWINRLTTEEQLAFGGQHLMGAHLVVPPPRGGDLHHGRRHIRPPARAHAPRHHDSPRLMALCDHPVHGAYGGLQPG